MSASMSAGYELSAQQKLFFVQGRQATVVGLALLLEGEADASKVRSALTLLVQRHEILRTRFQRRAGMKFPFQVVADEASFAWDEVDFSPVAFERQQSRISILLADASEIDIENGPVLHARLAKLDPRRCALILTISALCVDDASLNQIFAELGSLFSGDDLSSDVLQYADYSEWQNEFLSAQDEEAKQSANFWEKTEFDSLPALTVPFERKTATGEWSWSSLPVQLGSPIPDDFLFAVWQTFLCRISGRQEFALGFLSDGRNREEFASGVGLFARVLPLRINFDTAAIFSNHQKTATAISRAVDHQDYFSVDRVAKHVPIGFASFSAAEKSKFGKLDLSEITRRVPSPSFKLQLRSESASRFTRAFLEYDAAYFVPETIAQLAERFAIFASAAQANPESMALALPLMSDRERKRVLVEFNQTEAEFPVDNCIHELFEEQAAQHPDRPALRFGERELSYEDLNREANRIAHVLLKNGVTGNVPVALCIERSAEMIIALLGILKAGACYVPLAPDNPKPRLAHQLSETGAPVILTEQKHLTTLPKFSGKVICLDHDRALLDSAKDTNPALKSSPQDLVYVIYTSGSTGTPKGVAVRHSNLVNYSHFICRRLKLNEYSSGLHFATVSTISADLGNTCIFPSLISGGCLHVISYETAMSPALLAQYVTQHAIDVLKITPSHLTSLLNSDRADSVLPHKYLILGGEATRWDLVERIRKANKCTLLNHYGPTEATVGCCTFTTESDVSAWEPATLPIGKPIANDEIYILDGRMEPVPVGVAGELCVGGTGLAQGYLNQPEQTIARFVRNPFSPDPEARLYRTGDLARFLPDGNIEFLGRIDAQVKIRGFRVEPAEIESVLRHHPAVAQAAVVAYEPEPGDKKLAAYIVARSQMPAADCRDFLIQKLPEYMVPTAFVFIESLPLTANGKLDTRALPAPEQQPPIREAIGPRTPDEERLAQIWQEVLKRDRVGVTDNFFELGGHSLLATQIISRIRNGFRVQMPLHAFLQSPTIAALAEQLTQCPPVESEQEEMSRLLQELEGISDEEAERFLAADANKQSGGRR